MQHPREALSCRPKQKEKTKEYITILPLAKFKWRKVTASQVSELVFDEVRRSEKPSSFLHRKLGCHKICSMKQNYLFCSAFKNLFAQIVMVIRTVILHRFS